jgi:hypothetical protein
MGVYSLKPIPKSTTFFMTQGQTDGAVALFIGTLLDSYFFLYCILYCFVFSPSDDG